MGTTAEPPGADAKAESAAVMIQARIRGAQARKGLQGLRLPHSSRSMAGAQGSKPLPDGVGDECGNLSSPSDDQWEAPSTSLWCLSVHTPLRKFAIHVMTHPAFDNIVLAIIIANSVAMTMEDPLEDPVHP